MGIRPSEMSRGGGGLLNHVDATLVGYKFRADKVFSWGTPINCDLSFLVDGADQPVVKWLQAGTLEDFGGLSEDKLSILTPEGQQLWSDSELGIFLTSVFKPAEGQGFNEADVPEDPTRINLECLLGARMHLVNEVNDKKTSRRGKRKGTDGKEYEWTDLKALRYYGRHTDAPVNRQGAQATTTAKVGNGAVASKDVEAVEVLEALVQKAGGTLEVSKIPVMIAKHMGLAHPNRNKVQALITNPAFYEGLERLVYDEASKRVVAVG